MPRGYSAAETTPQRALEFRRAAAKLCEAARELRRHLDDPLWAKSTRRTVAPPAWADIRDAAQRLDDVAKEAPPIPS